MEYDSTVASVRAIARTSYFTFLDRRGTLGARIETDMVSRFVGLTGVGGGVLWNV